MQPGMIELGKMGGNMMWNQFDGHAIRSADD